MTSGPLPPLRPALAEVQRSGEASPEQVDVVLRALAKVDHRGFDPADLDAGEQLLASFTRDARAAESCATWRRGSSSGSIPTAPCRRIRSTPSGATSRSASCATACTPARDGSLARSGPS